MQVVMLMQFVNKFTNEGKAALKPAAFFFLIIRFTHEK